MTTIGVTTVLTDLLAEIAPDVDLDAVDLDADMRAEMDLDSMDFLNLVEGIAERTGVDIPEADYGQVRSFAGLVEYVTGRASADLGPRT